MIKIKDCRCGPMMYLTNDRIIGRSFEDYGESHYHELQVLSRLISPGDVVIDVGAHIGAVTVPLAKAIGKSGYVVAIEPQQNMYYMLCGNLALNRLNHVLALNRAAADCAGLQSYLPELDYDAEDNFGGIQLSSEAGSADAQGRNTCVPVATTTIDSLRLTGVKLIKIDVEGMEVPVLNGARQTIHREKPYLFMEFIAERREILSILKFMEYDWALCETFLFNENNFAGNKVDSLKNEQGLSLVSCDIVCWPKTGTAPDVPYLVDLDRSEHPRHVAIRQLRDQVNASIS